MKIHFKKVTNAHLGTIFSWLAEPHIMEFWDNTQTHKDDIVNFAEGRKTPSSYANGKYVYWIASLEDQPFAMLMTIQETHKEDIGLEKLKRLSKTGHTYGLDYMIGNSKFFGKGYGSQTLSDFIDYFRESIDPKADTFLIDPDSANLRAKHVYMKAGFKHVCDFMMEGDVSGAGKVHHLLIRKFDPKVSIRKSTLKDAQDVATIHMKAWQQSYKNIIEEDYLSNISFDERLRLREKLLLANAPNKIHLVALCEEKIIGFCDAGPAFENTDNYRGEIYAIYLLEEFKKLGVGQKLLQAAHTFLEDKTLLPYIAWVLKENHSACAFYEKNGGIVSGEKIEEIGSEFYTEISYIFGSSMNIRSSQPSDIDAMVLLSKAKRMLYEKAQPQFWRYAGDEGDNTQRQWFKELLEDENHVMFTAESDTQEILGFIIGKLIPAPEVYNPGGLTLMIDDFCVQSENLWQSVGTRLIATVKTAAKARGTTQIVVVCGAADLPKRNFLSEQNLQVASNWFVGGIV